MSFRERSTPRTRTEKLEDELYSACERGDLKRVIHCVEIRGADVNAEVGRVGFGFIPNPKAGLSTSSNLNIGLTPLHAAFYRETRPDSPQKENISWEQLEIIRCLVEAGANPSAGLPNGWIPIWMWGWNTFCTVESHHEFGLLIDRNFWCNPRAVHLLVELGMSVTQRCPFGRTILHQMAGPALMHDKEVFTFLLEKGADLNTQDYEGITPIIAAAIGNNKVPNIPILKLLLEKEEITNMDKISALEFAAALLIFNVTRVPRGENNTFADRMQEIVYFHSLSKTLRLQERCPLKDEEEKSGRIVESFTSLDNFQQVQQRSSEFEMQSILIRLRILSSISWEAFRRYLWPFISNRYCGAGVVFGLLEKYDKTLDVCRAVLDIILRQDNEEKGVYATKIGVVKILLNNLPHRQGSNDLLFSTEIFETTLDLLKPTYQALPPPADDAHLSRDYFHKFYRLIVMLDDLPDAYNTPKVQDFVLHIVGLNGRDSDGRSFLYHATREPSSKVLGVIDLLVRNGIDADAVDHAGNGALHYLAKMKKNCIQCEAAARLLIDHGAHLDRANREGKTAADIWPEKLENEWIWWSGFGGSNADRPEWMNEGVPQLKCLAARAARRQDLHIRVLNKDGLPKLPATLVRFVGMHRR